MERQFPDDPRGLDAFEYAFELYLRGVPDLEALDGFDFFKVLEETSTTLRIAGTGLFLPSGKLPIDATFHAVGDEIQYRILIGSDDETWASLTETKRWKAVYFYATEGLEPLWNWDQPIEGSLDE